MPSTDPSAAQKTLPTWVPDDARRYLEHTEAGCSIRALARRTGCHASTVLRQVRRFEARRDDPLIDAALTALGQVHFAEAAQIDLRRTKGEPPMTGLTKDELPDAVTLEREGARVLRRLCESGAVLAVAEGMEKAVVVRDGGARTAVLERAVAEAMALKDWIACVAPGRIARYTITPAGRAALARLLAQDDNAARARAEGGFAEAQAPFGAQHRVWGERVVAEESGPRRLRLNLAESPLSLLARRRGKDGRPFLSDDLVAAGERLREDFELAQMGPRVAQNWDRFLTGGARGGFAPDSGAGSAPESARRRVARALSDLGPGLSDVALRCCCFLEGLETTEKRMGWSARSGKIVLRIALQRLQRHYEESGSASRMIG